MIDYKKVEFSTNGDPWTLAQTYLKAGMGSAIQASAWVDGREVFSSALGRTREDNEGTAIHRETLFDLASITKAIGTSYMAMRLVAEGALDLRAPVARYMEPALGLRLSPTWGRVTPLDLLNHRAGLVGHRKLWAELDGTGKVGFARRAVRAIVTGADLRPRPAGFGHEYSDLGYILLGLILEQAGSTDLAGLWRHWRPKRAIDGANKANDGLEPLDFRVPPAASDGRFVWSDDPTVVATEAREDSSGFWQGVVHDENCRAMGGVAGHAGLFGCAQAVAAMGAYLCECWHGEHAELPASIVRDFFTVRPEPDGATWALGWDTPSPTASSAGRHFPSGEAVGHLGFTGTSLWMWPRRRIVVALLTNRVHPSRNDMRIRAFRPAFHDALWASGLLGDPTG